MTIHVILPRQFRARNLFPLIKNEFGTFENIPDTVNFDFQQLDFVRPSGVVFLSNLTKYLLRNGCEVSFSGMREGTNSIRFLDDSLFFEQHTGKKLLDKSGPRSTTLPLIEIRHSDSHAWIGSRLVPWLSVSAGVTVGQLAVFRTCISELFNNIKDHTEFDVGSLFAQWYPNENTLEICIADFGAGIPCTVRRIEPDLDDTEAIVKSFEDGFSSQSTPRNRGAGLHYLHQNIVENLSGKLTVQSGEAAVIFEKDGNYLRTMPYNIPGYCPGTMITLEVRTDQIFLETDEPEDFEW